MKLRDYPLAIAEAATTDDTGELLPGAAEALDTLQLSLDDKVSACVRRIRDLEDAAHATPSETPLFDGGQR